MELFLPCKAGGWEIKFGSTHPCGRLRGIFSYFSIYRLNLNSISCKFLVYMNLKKNFRYIYIWIFFNRRTGLEPYVPRCILKTLEEHFEKLSIPPLSNIGYCTLGVDQIVSLSEWNSTDQNIIIPRWLFFLQIN